jgi:hypothetical protein
VLAEAQDDELSCLVLAGNAWSFNHETLDSRGDKSSMKDLEHGHPVCTQDDCGETMYGRDVMRVTTKGESDHGVVTGTTGSPEAVLVLRPKPMTTLAD